MSSQPTNIFSEETAHKYTFQLELKKLSISPSLPFDVKIIWARNQNRIESQNPIKLQPPDNEVILQECFCNKSTVVFNPKKFQFRKKQSKIHVILYANGSPKQGGEVVLNLCQILDPYNIKKQQEKVYRVVTRQERPRCELEFKLTAEYYQEMVKDERSMGSDLGSISSKNTTSLKQQPSSLSNNLDAKQYIEKKNLFLCNFFIILDEAPSKDNQSVASYSSYSTGMMRYNSGKKEREDSTRKEDYGMVGNTTRREITADMFSKTANTNIIKSIGGEFDTKSKGGYNRVTQQQYDNRTQNYDPQTSKQLQQEQSRRSKLQAEVSRLNIYMKEQSSKLTEYIQENTRLKQQLNRVSAQQQNVKPIIDKETSTIRQQYEEQINKMRHESDQLHNRTFELNNENRELTRRFETLLDEKQSLEEEIRRVRNDKERVEVRFQSLGRNVDMLVGEKESSLKEVNNLRDELQHAKSLNSTLRQSLEKQRRRVEELQYSNNYQKSTLEQTTKKREQRLYELQRENSSLLGQLRDRLENSANDYKEKVIASEGDKNKMLQDNASLRSETDKLRRDLIALKQTLAKAQSDKSSDYEQRYAQLESNNYQTLQKLRTLEIQLEQTKKNHSQLLVLNDTLKNELEDKKNESYRLQTNIRGLKEMESKFYSLERVQTQKDKQILAVKQQNNRLMYKITELQDQCRKISSQLEETKKQALNVPNVDVNQILRESVQMQVELKFKTDELLRLKGIEEKYEDLSYRLELSEKNRGQTEQEVEKLEKQLKDKNKLYLIEVEKGKLILREKNQIERLVDQLRTQLKRCQEIIFNGDRQVKEMEQHINFLQNENQQIKNQFHALQSQLTLLTAKLTESSRIQSFLRELEKESSQKTQTIDMLNTNLATAQKRIIDMETTLFTRQTETQEAIRNAQSSSQKLIELESTQSSLSQELHRTIHEKKSLELKCETMLQELHSLKKQFEEQKLRSTSVVSIRSSEDQVKIRQLQNQLEKKDKLISKLSKQKLEIEEENINLHVQVMKKLSEMEKTKETTQGQ